MDTSRAPSPIWDAAHATAGDAASWVTHAAPGSSATIRTEAARGGAELRFDFDLAGPTSWVIARREVELTLPEHYVARIRLRSTLAPNQFQLKLIDPSNANVWWWRQPIEASAEITTLVLRRSALGFAWGPASGAPPREIGAIEVALAAGQGGAGTLWIETIEIAAREAVSGSPRVIAAQASSHASGHESSFLVDGAPGGSWCPAPDDPAPALELDLGTLRECGGVVMVLDGDRPFPPTRVYASDTATGDAWALVSEDGGGTQPSRWLARGEHEARRLRIELGRPAGGALAVRRVEIVPIERVLSPAAWAASRAREAPRGRFPRHLLGEQAYWAIAGGDGDAEKGLLSEDGALEVAAEGFTLEPFLVCEASVLSWADVVATPALVDGSLPLPTVTWSAGDLSLEVSAFATGLAEDRALVARYRLSHRGEGERRVRLVIAIRPYQVTPAWQSLNVHPAVAPIERLARRDDRIVVDGRDALVLVTPPTRFGVASTADGLASIFDGGFPEAAAIDDPLGFAEGALAYDLCLAPGATETVTIAVPRSVPAAQHVARSRAWADERFAEAAEAFRSRLAAIPIELPPAAARFRDSLRASVGWILLNRDGPRIQPGPRCYRRSWIRDGTLTGTALAEMGFAEEARAFLRWYAPYQHEDGRVPCAVDHAGIDPVAEHDSHGQLAWGVVEVYRLTGDERFLRELWPRVALATDAIARLRSTRLDDDARARGCYGLMPESISHEGYSSQPVHSFWDDFFAVRGLAHAAIGAEVLGETAAAKRIAALRDAMRADLHAAVAATLTRHGIDVIPGSVELGDFDPTSTSIAFDPCEEAERFPRAALVHTFERYWEELEARRAGRAPNDGYTPYEIRNATALLRLGWKDRALAQLEWLIGDQRPPAWCQWPEVAWREQRAARFLGDLPHGWVASSFVRTVRRLVAYEREADGALVIGAGIPAAWARDPAGVRVRALPTPYGPLSVTITAASAPLGDGEVVRFAFEPGLCAPPGGVELISPLDQPLRRVLVDGQPAAIAPGAKLIHLARIPFEVEIRTGLAASTAAS